ncbi:MAG: sulfatase-like hydrolase/transferase [Cyclobacteriaceae bacterium]|nr:sulfatase-like hydrolase/transferase [Cyclobacteriaceae bacterium]
MQKPIIILIMYDDQGRGDMGYYGHPVLQTPNFDKMAAEGLCLDRFCAAACLFTSKGKFAYR